MMGMPQITSLTPSIWDAMTKYFMVHALLKKKKEMYFLQFWQLKHSKSKHQQNGCLGEAPSIGGPFSWYL